MMCRATARTTACLIALAVLVTLLVSAGCAGSRGVLNEPDTKPPQVMLDPPGIYAEPRGGVRAVGIFDLIDIDRGVWAVIGVASGAGAESRVVAVIANPDDLRLDLPALRGRYVEVLGELKEGASARAAGPEIEARSVTIIAEDDPDDWPQPTR